MDSSFHGDTTFAMNGMDGGGANPTFLPPKAEEARTSHKRTRAQMASGSTVPKVEKKVRRAASHIEHSCNNCAADLLDGYSLCSRQEEKAHLLSSGEVPGYLGELARIPSR